MYSAKPLDWAGTIEKRFLSPVWKDEVFFDKQIQGLWMTLNLGLWFNVQVQCGKPLGGFLFFALAYAII